MAFSSGTFSLVAGNPVVTATTISSTWANNTLSDIATGLSTCILKDGTQTCTASIPFAEGLSIADGKAIASGATATAFAGATTSLTIGGTGATSTVAVPGTLDATSTTAASLKTAGGLGVAKAAYIGTTLNVAGTSTLAAVNASGAISGAIGFRATGGFITNAAGATGFDYDSGVPEGRLTVWGANTGSRSGLSIYLRSSDGSLGTTAVITISNAGAVTIPALAGVGSRHVVVDANGVLSAP